MGVTPSKMLTRLVRFGLLALLLPTQLTNLVGVAALTNRCPSPGFTPHGGSCYLLVQTAMNFNPANDQCRTEYNGYLAEVETVDEYTYIQEFTANRSSGANANYDVWIGLTDMFTQGIYQWVRAGSAGPQATFPTSKLAPGEIDRSRPPGQNCVTLRPGGLFFDQEGCTGGSGNFYLCEQSECVDEACTVATVAESSSSTTTIVVIVVVLVLLIVVVIVFLFYIWKYHNAKWELYVCYLCKMRESKAKVHSLEQENQRLRRQLSHQRSVSQISLTGNGETALPDGTGVALPTLHGMVGPTPTSPGGSRSPQGVRRMTSTSMSTGPLITRNMSNASIGGGQPRNPMSRQPSLAMSMGRTRAAPGSLNLADGQDPMGINSPRQAFVGMPTFASTSSVGSRRSSQNTSVSGAFEMHASSSSPIRNQVFTVQEDPDAEDAEAREMAYTRGRPSSRRSLPGGVDEL